MCEERLKSEWDRTVAIVSKVHNANCTKPSDLIRDPNSIHPLRHSVKRPKLSVKEARRMMTGRK